MNKLDKLYQQVKRKPNRRPTVTKAQIDAVFDKMNNTHRRADQLGQDAQHLINDAIYAETISQFNKALTRLPQILERFKSAKEAEFVAHEAYKVIDKQYESQFK